MGYESAGRSWEPRNPCNDRALRTPPDTRNVPNCLEASNTTALLGRGLPQGPYEVVTTLPDTPNKRFSTFWCISMHLVNFEGDLKISVFRHFGHRQGAPTGPRPRCCQKQIDGADQLLNEKWSRFLTRRLFVCFSRCFPRAGGIYSSSEVCAFSRKQY